MHETETRALRRAVALLLLITAVRWGWTSRGDPPAVDDATVLPELLAASRSAANEVARRDTPLGDDERIDPNRADAVELDRLPGIGPSTAEAIVAARDEGRVFRVPEDLLAVRGIGPATLDRIRERLALDAPPPAPRPRGSADPASDKVDVSTAAFEELQRLPGIGPALAERILVARREQAFSSIDDLVRVRGIGPATLERLRPHASVAGSAR